MAAKTANDRFFIPDEHFEPAYLALYRSGELRRRVESAIEQLARCNFCPRHCNVDRLADKTAACKSGRYAVVSSHFPHMGEEDCLRGWRGSGTIFFAWCNLRCVFCQNFEVSQQGEGYPALPEELAGMMLNLQAMGCHNINFVTPEHVVPQILEALLAAVEGGLRLPLVYNTSAYDDLTSLKLMDGVVDIYMPDFKLWNPELSLRYLKARDYPEAARQAIQEMHRQVGDLKFDQNHLAKRGLLIRHLVMPGLPEETKAIMRFLAEDISPDTFVNIMAQYRPAGKVSAEKYPEINRTPTHREYQEAVDMAKAVGLWRFDERRPWILLRRFVE
jgi:putative pyruvate formate lyase activating enzyme